MKQLHAWWANALQRGQHAPPRGDTIVEVLISIVVVTPIIAGSFVVLNVNTKAVRDAKERAEATYMLQGQVEGLRAIAGTDAVQAMIDHTGQSVFCVDRATGTTVSLNGGAGLVLPPLANDSLNSPGSYPAVCKQDRYYLSVEAPTASRDTFLFHARWAGLTSPREEVRLAYRLHKNVVLTPPSGPPPPAPPSACPLAAPVTYVFNPGGPRDDWHSDDNRISGPDGVEPQTLGPYPLSLPAGGIPAWNDYRVTIITYDTHDLFDPDTNLQERARIVLRNGGGTATYTSPYTIDVPTTLLNGVRQGPDNVFTGQTIAGGTATVTAEHIGIGGDGFHVDRVTVSCP